MKKRKYNWVDGLIVVVVLLLIVGTCVKFMGRDVRSTKTPATAFSYELSVRGVRQITVDALQEGDIIYDNAGKGTVGVISAMEAVPAVENAGYPDGTIREMQLEDRFDVTLTIEAEGTVADGAYRIGTYDIKVNHSDIYFTKYAIFTARVVKIPGAAA